jgi:hypothetical protein
MRIENATWRGVLMLKTRWKSLKTRHFAGDVAFSMRASINRSARATSFRHQKCPSNPELKRAACLSFPRELLGHPLRSARPCTPRPEIEFALNSFSK